MTEERTFLDAVVAGVQKMNGEAAERLRHPQTIIIGSDGRCECTCADTCPILKTGMSLRCTYKDLNDAGIPTQHRSLMKVAEPTPVHGFLPPLAAGSDAEKEYLNSLKPDERVIETGESCMTGRTGTIYISSNKGTEGSLCVMWDIMPPETGKMGTAVTHGTRRISDVIAAVNSIQ